MGTCGRAASGEGLGQGLAGQPVSGRAEQRPPWRREGAPQGAQFRLGATWPAPPTGLPPADNWHGLPATSQDLGRLFSSACLLPVSIPSGLSPFLHPPSIVILSSQSPPPTPNTPLPVTGSSWAPGVHGPARVEAPGGFFPRGALPPQTPPLQPQAHFRGLTKRAAASWGAEPLPALLMPMGDYGSAGPALADHLTPGMPTGVEAPAGCAGRKPRPVCGQLVQPILCMPAAPRLTHTPSVRLWGASSELPEFLPHSASWARKGAPEPACGAQSGAGEPAHPCWQH